MLLLLERSGRPLVTARLSEFVVDLENELARLREDLLQLDDEDRRALRLFHLRKARLPGAAVAADEVSPKPELQVCLDASLCQEPEPEASTTDTVFAATNDPDIASQS